MEFRILGPLEVVDDEGRVLQLGGARQRALLAALLLHANEVVLLDRLMEELWGGRPPATGAKALQVAVSQLRKTLGNGILQTRPAGYLLRVEPDQLDVTRFERLRERARASLAEGRPAEAARALREALGLWRGVGAGRHRLRGVRSSRGAAAGGAAAGGAGGADRRGSVAGPARGTRGGAGGAGGEVPAAGAASRAADARAVPVGAAGGSAGGVPGHAAAARRGAGDRAEHGPPGA